MTRPNTVIFALVLLFFMLIYSVWKTYASVESLWFADTSLSGGVFIQGFWLSFLILNIAIPIGLGFAAFTQRNWARVALVIYFVVGWILVIFIEVNDGNSATLLKFDLLGYIGVEIVIIILLFAPESSKWFCARQQSA